MDKPESLEDFYRRKFDWMPASIRQEIGHFNLFRLEPFVGEKAQPVPYRRRDFYKITLVQGGGRVHYADRMVTVKKQALSFSNPLIPYKWEHTDQIRQGCFCIFNRQFFREFGNLNQYAVFQPGGEHIFELSDAQTAQVLGIYDRMFEEFNSEYIHKYDVLRNLVFELLHFALKMQPSSQYDQQQANAAQRIATLFLELLERQFPIEENHPQVQVRSASDFAQQLNIHVNHLNRAVKTCTGKTTTQLIGERLFQEAKIMLRHSTWNVSEIAYALGFTEVTHFNSFFKKMSGLSPSGFRKTLQ